MLIKRTIRVDDKQYRIHSKFDDAALMEDRFNINIEASVRHMTSRKPIEWSKWQTETLTLSLDPVGEFLVLSHRERSIARIPLSLDVSDGDDFEGNGLDLEGDAVLIEEFIEAIPAMDPLLGCLVRGAASSLVGQTIRCWRSGEKGAEIQWRVRQTMGCLSEHGLRMGFVFMYRAGKCVLKAGM